MSGVDFEIVVLRVTEVGKGGELGQVAVAGGTAVTLEPVIVSGKTHRSPPDAPLPSIYREPDHFSHWRFELEVTDPEIERLLLSGPVAFEFWTRHIIKEQLSAFQGLKVILSRMWEAAREGSLLPITEPGPWLHWVMPLTTWEDSEIVGCLLGESHEAHSSSPFVDVEGEHIGAGAYWITLDRPPA